MRWALVAVAGGSAVVAFFSLTAEAGRLGGWFAGSNCVAEDNPLDVVFLLDNEVLPDASPPKFVDKTKLSTQDPRYGFIKHNLRTACESRNTACEHGPTYFKDELNTCAQRTSLDITNDDLEAAALRGMVKTPPADVSDTILTNDGGLALMAAATTDFRPGSIRLLVIYTGASLNTDIVRVQCGAPPTDRSVYYTPYCGSSTAFGLDTLATVLVLNQVAPIVYIRGDAVEGAYQEWATLELFLDLDYVTPHAFLYGGSLSYFTDTVWTQMAQMEHYLRCADELGLLVRFTVGLADEVVAAPEDHIKFVILLDDRFTTPEVLESIPSFSVDYAGIRFNRNRVACENGVFAVPDREGCGAPTTAAGYKTGYSPYSSFVDAMKPGYHEDIDPNSSVRSNDLVNVLHGAMAYPLDNINDAQTRRVLFIYTRQYPGVEYDSPECQLNRNPRDQFTILCTEDGSGDFGEVWKELIETETRVVIVIPEQRFSDQKADNEAVRQGWEEAIKATGVGLDRYWIYENVTFASVVTSYYTDHFGGD